MPSRILTRAFVSSALLIALGSGGAADQSGGGRHTRSLEKATGGMVDVPMDQIPVAGPPGSGRFVDPDLTGPAGTQAELSIATDSTGQHTRRADLQVRLKEGACRADLQVRPPT